MKADTCGCCELPPSTPFRVFNRPGLRAVAFRAGTYASFRLSMLQRIAGTQALSALQTRSDDDYAITFLDMWATVADVLTFYQERFANETYLRTARYRDSILRMARLLDYHLQPGVAATTLFAFTLDRDASLRIPIGLRVQSVPADSEKPQIYETLEAILADARLNNNRVFPAPEGFNPLARGSTSAILAPGPEGLAAAAALSPGIRFIIFEANPPARIEELAVRELRLEDGRLVLFWSGPIQGSNWSFDSEAYAINRTFRVFGYNAPATYMEAVETPAGSGDFIWTQRTFSSYAYPAGNSLELDTKYEGIPVGTRLLICQPTSNTLVTVRAVSQGQTIFKAPSSTTSPVQDTVTILTLSAPVTILDRRTTLIHEVSSPRLRFWGYRYGEKLSGPTVYVPVVRIDGETVEIGRAIENNKFKPGSRFAPKTITVGRQVLLHDSIAQPIAGKVTAVTAIGLDVTVVTTPNDLTTAGELRLTPEEAQRFIGLRSAPLAAIALTNSKREVSVTIGRLPPRTVKLITNPANVADAAAALQAGMNASLPATPEFSQSRVTPVGGALIVLPGLPGISIEFAPAAADETTAAELGLVSPEAIRIDALVSGDLSAFPVLANPVRELSVTFGPVGPRTVVLTGVLIDVNGARSALESALRNANPSPAFNRVMVSVLGSRLLVLPGTGGSSIQEYLAITLQPESTLELDTNSAVLLGNIALASHGETVSDEVLGDGDASMAFQKFELQKKPLTYVPSAGPDGTESTLHVQVNDIRWTEVPSLFGRGPTDQVYTARLADDGTVTVGFGDGRSGARLPSGPANVVVDYRTGAGLSGRVAAGALRAPLDLPVGLKSVRNPAAATGGADPESVEQARENAPTTVRTFGRAVSLRDFEDLARTSGEVAKALATWVWNREARAVHLTIAAQKGQLFTPTDLTRIHASLDAQRDPNHALFLDNYIQVPVVIKATVAVKSAYVASRVAAASVNALLAALSFESRGFGQPLDLSDIYAVLQQVEGVSFVDIDRFHFKNQSAAFLAARGATADAIQRSLRIFSARPNSTPSPPALPAELAIVEVPAEDLQIISSGGLPD